MSNDAPARVGPYDVIREIARGGMGVVYLAFDARLGREVAVKVLPAEFSSDEDRVARFEREAKALASLNHPNTLTVFDVGREAGLSFLVMELLNGGTLRERFDGRAVPWPKVVDLACGIVDGIAAAHDRGVVHRDIKPDNVFLTDDGVVKILDFGLAAPEPETAPGADAPTVTRLTGADMVLGTPAYMSPEQVRGERADARSDIFSVGCVLHELLTGVSPFARATRAETLAAVLGEEPQITPRAETNVPPELDRVVRRCLEKNTRDRFQSAKDLAFTMRSLVGGSTSTVTTEPAPGCTDVPSIAVLPFANLSTDPDNEYFSSGITDELISALVKIRGLRVPGRTSAFSFKDDRSDIRKIGRELNVEAVLEGSVRRAGQRIRVTVQLVNVRDGYQLWSERFDRELGDVFAVQDEIARAIVERLSLVESNKPVRSIIRAATGSVEAYEEYLRGRFAYEQRGQGLLEAPQHFERAIELDPSFAVAHAGLAETFAMTGFYGLARPDEIMPKAKQAAQRGLAIDSAIAEAHTALGHVHLLYDWDWNAAELAYDRALTLKPKYPPALIGKGGYLRCFVQGRYEEGLPLVREAVEHDPLNGANIASLAAFLFVSGNERDAYALLNGAATRFPQTFMVFNHLGGIALLLGEHEIARKSFAHGMSISGRHVWPLVGLMNLFFLEGQMDRAAALNDEMHERARHEYMPAFFMAMLPALKGHIDEAFSYLKRAVAERESVLITLKRWPPNQVMTRRLQNDPRFAKLLSRVSDDRPGNTVPE